MTIQKYMEGNQNQEKRIIWEIDSHSRIFDHLTPSEIPIIGLLWNMP